MGVARSVLRAKMRGVTSPTHPIFAVPLEHLHGVSLVAQIRGGPRFEAPDECGLTHFLEHMLFRGAGVHPTSRPGPATTRW